MNALHEKFYRFAQTSEHDHGLFEMATDAALGDRLGRIERNSSMDRPFDARVGQTFIGVYETVSDAHAGIIDYYQLAHGVILLDHTVWEYRQGKATRTP